MTTNTLRKAETYDELGCIERKPISGRYPWGKTSDSDGKDETK